MIELDERTLLSLRYTAAKFRLGVLPASEMKQTIAALAETGLWDDTFLEVLETTANQRDIREPFEVCLAALAVLPADRPTALRDILAHHTTRIVSGAVDPCDGLYELFERDLSNDADAFRGPFGAQPTGALRLRSLHEDCTNLEMRFATGDVGADLALAAHRRRIIDAARHWLAAYKRRLEPE